jgi:formylmethanofuran dehydrogenase subunit A
MCPDILIKNGLVFDPANGISGEKLDIGISDGKIVDPARVSGDADIIDADGRVVMPGGVDIHSHIAGAKVNMGRLFRPEDHWKDHVSLTTNGRSGTGYSVPSTYITGYRYAQMGYTTVIEPAMPPVFARHTHEEFNDIPIIDKAAFPLYDNNWFVMELIKNKDFEGLAAYAAWLLRTTKGYAIKLVNPGGAEMWAWGKAEFGHLDDQVAYFDVSPRDIITSMVQVNEKLGLPHTVHLHANNLGHPGNFEITKETFDCVKGIEPKNGRKSVLHLTHCQFNSYGGADMVTWNDFRSEAETIADYLNENDHITIDVGQVVLGENTTTMTADSPWEHALYHVAGQAAWGVKPGVKWINHHAETEAGAGLVPYIFDPKVSVNAIQWAIGLELFLMVKNPWQVFLTTDHPNAGPFTRYPEIIALLMDKQYRDAQLAGVSKVALERTKLAEMDRVYSLDEIAVITRAGTARCLGMANKGHLGEGAEGSVAIYDLDPATATAPEIIKAFRNTWCTIKSGVVASRVDNVEASIMGKTIWTDIHVPEDQLAALVQQVKKEWNGRYTVSYNNYPVFDSFVPNPTVVKVGSD